MADHTFCRLLVKAARETAKEYGVPLPKHITAWEGFDKWFEVYAGTKLVWQGEAHCAYEARAEAISALTNQHIKQRSNDAPI